MKYLKRYAVLLGALLQCSYSGVLDTLPANTWVRVALSPGDALGREIPPGRAATWTYCPLTHTFLRYGGYTPSFSNALLSFNPDSVAWKVMQPYDNRYPSDRPGGGSSWLLAWDSLSESVIMAGGWQTGSYGLGDRGVWRYYPLTNTFGKIGGAIPGFETVNTILVYDSKQRTLVSSLLPRQTYGAANKTFVFPVDSARWVVKTTLVSPQTDWRGNYPMCHAPALNGTFLFRGDSCFLYDASLGLWTALAVIGVMPSARLNTVMAYDPDNQAVFMYGGYTSAVEASKMLTDTWAFDVRGMTWKRIACPGIPLNAKAVYYTQALAWDPVHHCMLLNDADLGVYAFRYDPTSPAGTTVINSGSTDIGHSASNPPASGDVDRIQTPSYALNPRLLSMADNSLLLMDAAMQTGEELMWDYDSVNGIILQYGGCGNGSNPYWTAYGSSLDLYDPGNDAWHSRRVSDATGAARPQSGCTRSTLWDGRRNLWWFFGGLSGGPYNPAPDTLSPNAVYSYDIATDRFKSFDVPQTAQDITVAYVGCHMAYDPDHDIAINPWSGCTWIYDFKTNLWSSKPCSTGPGGLYAYNRTVYVSSLKKFACLQDNKTDSTLTLWSYDPVTNYWDSIASGNAKPPYRNSKFGLAHDPDNNILLLAAGQIGWNGIPISDLWIYHLTTNLWERVQPAPENEAFPISDCMKIAYDKRHRVFLIGNGYRNIFAYKYKDNPLKAETHKAPLALSISACPNPFVFDVGLTLNLHQKGTVTIDVFDLGGRHIKSISNGVMQAGKRTFHWKTGDDKGRGHPSGVYVVQVICDSRCLTKKIVLAR